MEFFDELPGARNVRQQPRIDWVTAKADIMANPGKWGLMAENVSPSTPGQIKQGRYAAFPVDELKNFEFRVRRPAGAGEEYGERRSDLYGRYLVGAEDA